MTVWRSKGSLACSTGIGERTREDVSVCVGDKSGCESGCRSKVKGRESVGDSGSEIVGVIVGV
jgi:hypothetical protein